MYSIFCSANQRTVIQALKHRSLDHALRLDRLRVERNRIAAAEKMARRQTAEQSACAQRHLRVLRAGAPWRDMPERYGPYTTAYNRFNRWRKAGIWNRLMDGIVKAHGGKVQMIDSSLVRVQWRSLCGAKPRRPHNEDPRPSRRERPPGLPPDLAWQRPRYRLRRNAP
jgi:transposase